MNANRENGSPFNREQGISWDRELYGHRKMLRKVSRVNNEAIRTIRFPSDIYQGLSERIRLASENSRLSTSLSLRENRERLHQLNKLYRFDILSSELGDFLAKNIFLVDLLKDARRKISEYFGDEFIPRLKISYIPESNILDELWVLIPTKLPVSQALDKLDRFDEEWWLDASERAHCKMNIKMEYV